jgi:hypothetical protein
MTTLRLVFIALILSLPTEMLVPERSYDSDYRVAQSALRSTDKSDAHLRTRLRESRVARNRHRSGCASLRRRSYSPSM